MSLYESHAQMPYKFTWYNSVSQIDRIYVPTPTYGADTNSTVQKSGLVMFTDANFTKANFYRKRLLSCQYSPVKSTSIEI